MSRREHITSQSHTLLDFLQEHNCIFYSPLSYEDTTDWISGNAMMKYSANSVVWDSANQIWKFQHVSGQPYNNTQYAARWTLGIPIPSGTPWNICCVMELYAYYTSDSNACYDLLPTRQGFGVYGTLNQLTQSAQVFAVSGSSTDQYRYRNGAQVFTYHYSTVLAMPYEDMIRIGQFAFNNYAEMLGPYGVRNMAFFLQSFTLSEINEYFNLI